MSSIDRFTRSYASTPPASVASAAPVQLLMPLNIFVSIVPSEREKSCRVLHGVFRRVHSMQSGRLENQGLARDDNDEI